MFTFVKNNFNGSKLGKHKIVRSIPNILMKSIFNEGTLFNVKKTYTWGGKYL